MLTRQSSVSQVAVATVAGSVIALFVGCTRGRPDFRPASGVFSQRLSCSPHEGLTPLLHPGAALLVGEMHGTEESPRFVADVACAALAQGLPVTVALEIPREERSRIETFLRSSGTSEDRERLLAGRFWLAPFQDGRRSRAMLALFEGLRRLRMGERLRVALIDREAAPATAQIRDRWMADALRAAFAARPRGFLVSLTGNVHSRIERGVPWNPDFEPAGFILRGMEPSLVVRAIDVSYARGSAWICETPAPESCGVREVAGRGADRGGAVVLFPEIRGGYSGVYEVGSITASRPAKSRG